MSNAIQQIKESIENRINLVLPGSWVPLSYVEEIEKNSFRGVTERYAVRPLEATETSGVVGTATFQQQFEIVLTKLYFESNVNENKKIATGLELREFCLDVYRELIHTKAGLPTRVMNVSELVIAEPQYLTESFVVVQRAQLLITWRINL
jgi:hypothetical protein